MADNRPALLLHVNLVIFLLRTGTGERDLLRKTISVESVINKFTAIV